MCHSWNPCDCFRISNELSLGENKWVLGPFFARGIPKKPNRKQADRFTCACYFHYGQGAVLHVLLLCVHKGQMCARWISITLWLFRSIQSWDKYTGTKYPSQLMLFASVKWLYIYMYNTITIWYTTMYHETFVVFKHTRAFSWEAFTIKYRTATRIS